ncbi:MAG: hypothetical protein WDN26_20825 [Chitinophagaceae bacterium]
MKTVLIIIFASALSISASAQKFGSRPMYHPVRSHVVISTGIYAPYSPYYGYYGFPYSYPMYAPRPTRLELKIDDIRNDYQDKIWSAKHDKTISRKEKRATVHELKHERDKAVIDAKRNYYIRR